MAAYVVVRAESHAEVKVAVCVVLLSDRQGDGRPSDDLVPFSDGLAYRPET